MIQGTSSSAGKSLLVTALCRLLLRRGYRVAPFKAQNMSNNARVCNDGEIGVAQYLQAQAAGVEASVEMNPVLVKPEADGQSQVIVKGRADHDITAMPWQERPAELWPPIVSALDSLLDRYDLLVLEGAGSPAEINLRRCDLANMAIARHAEAQIVLVADIDRGGALAHIYGTWALQRPDDQRRLAAFLVNRFRGDERLLAPGLRQLSLLTGMASLGALPMIDHLLPDEDATPAWQSRVGAPAVAIIRYPSASNLDEYWQLAQVANIVWAERPSQLLGCELVILPGAKDVEHDLAWLHRSGLARAIRELAAQARPLLGICGGMQMLGARLGSERGLELLDVTTDYRSEKLVARREFELPPLDGYWRPLSGLVFDAYDIRHGRISADVRQIGSVLGLACHGLFESPRVLTRLFQTSPKATLERVIDDLADEVAQHLDVDRLLGCVGVAA